MALSVSNKSWLRPSLSIVALTVANLVPLLGVIFLYWDVGAIVLLYWTENLIVGFFNVLKMILAKVGSWAEVFLKLFLIPFFCFHFGAFCAFHGFFIMLFFVLETPDLDAFTPTETFSDPLIFLQVLITALGLFVSHAISFIRNYVIGKEYLSAQLGELMNRPYKRIVVIHVAIVAGGLLVMKLGSPAALLFVLIFLKIGMDIRQHIKSHQRAESLRG